MRSIAETLDTGIQFRQWLHGNDLEAKYSFAMARTPGGLRIAPPDFPLRGKTSDEMRSEIEAEFGVPPPHLQGLLFEVEFLPLEKDERVRAHGREVDTARVVSMHFGRRECRLEFQPIGKRFYWRPTGENSYRDEGDLSSGDALRVFAGVSQIALKYNAEHRPNGILVGTSWESRDSRGRIYRRIAERIASETGATIITPEDAQGREKNLTLVWSPRLPRPANYIPA